MKCQARGANELERDNDAPRASRDFFAEWRSPVERDGPGVAAAGVRKELVRRRSQEPRDDIASHQEEHALCP